VNILRWNNWKEPVSTLIALGVPGLVLLVAVEIAGVSGAAAIVAGLAWLGGPLGMVGGFVTLGILVLVSKKIGEYGFDRLFSMVLKGVRDSGKTKKQIFEEVDSYKIPDRMKRALREWVEQFWSQSKE
jgi:hypothetical protein